MMIQKLRVQNAGSNARYFRCFTVFNKAPSVQRTDETFKLDPRVKIDTVYLANERTNDETRERRRRRDAMVPPPTFADMFAASPASLRKMRTHNSSTTTTTTTNGRDDYSYSPVAFSIADVATHDGTKTPGKYGSGAVEQYDDVYDAFAGMFAASPASLSKMRATAERTTSRAEEPRAVVGRREDVAETFGDMFLASPASLKKMRSMTTTTTTTRAAFGSPVALGAREREEHASVGVKEPVHFADMFSSSPADLAKMRRANVGGAERGMSVSVPKFSADAAARAGAFAGMFASSPADLAKMRGKPSSNVSYASGRHGGDSRFQVVAPDFQAMFASSPSDLKKLRSASTSKKMLGVESDRFEVTYLLIAGTEVEAKERVLEICLEQTVELPSSLVPEGTWIREHVVGRLETLSKPTTGPHAHRRDAWLAVVSYHADTTGGELTQLVNVIFGNTSMKENVMVMDVHLPSCVLKDYPGPRFGVDGLRRLLGVPEGPLVMTALKPMGLSSQELAEIAYGFAKGGVDIIKDDHGLADQPYSPYDERIRMCSEAVAQANMETGRNCLYAPCINAPAHLIISRAHAARQAGAGAVLMIPGITGLDVMRELASDSSFNLPIIAHPALLGCMLGGGSTNRVAGFSHEVLLGVLPRLAGADATVFPSFGGRFGFSVEECQAINAGCTRPMGNMPSILPSPGGGMTLERIAQMREVYGPDLLLLIGGSLYAHSENLIESARHFMKLAGRKELYGPKERPHDGHRSHRM